MNRYDRLIFRLHAIKRMFERNISEEDVKYAIVHGIVIQDYPEDQPYPSALILGWRKNRPLHVVAASSDSEQLTVIITAYEPEPDEWDKDFKTRRREK
jgi:Domain of unknown function (DUF4258)